MTDNPTTYAAIDIGSNAARLLIKKVRPNSSENGKKLTKVLLVRVPLRLGFDVFKKGEISKDKTDKIVSMMKAYKELMSVYEVDCYRACATSAMRDSKNGKAIIKKVYKASGLNIEIIDGQQEAALIYNNHIECLEDRSGNYAYIDVGGGSTEVNMLTDGSLVFSKSYNIGTVRMLSKADKKETWELMRGDLKRLAALYPGINLIGTGGNINKLYKLADEKDKEKLRFTVSSLKDIYQKLKPLTPAERIDAFHLKADRADVIVPAAEVFIDAAEALKAEYIHVPVIGLSDGIVDSLYARNAEKQAKKNS